MNRSIAFADNLWCAPAILCGLFILPLRNRPLVRTCLLDGLASLAVGLGAWIVRSPALARFPLPYCASVSCSGTSKITR